MTSNDIFTLALFSLILMLFNPISISIIYGITYMINYIKECYKYKIEKTEEDENALTSISLYILVYIITLCATECVIIINMVNFVLPLIIK